MSVQTIGAVFNLDIPSTEKLVLLSLANHTSEDGVCWVGMRRMMVMTSLSERCIRDSCRSLEKKGLLMCEPRFRGGEKSQTTNLWAIVDGSFPSFTPSANCPTPRHLPPHPPASAAPQESSFESSVKSEQSAATRNNVREGQNVTSPEQQPTTLKAKLNERTLATSAGNASQQQAAASADEYGGRRPRSKRAPAPRPAAPTIEEWHAYAKATFPWWPAVDCEGAYAHYEKNNWAFKDGRAIANWKGCARTCSNNWKRDNAAAYMAARRSAETAARAPYAPFGGE